MNRMLRSSLIGAVLVAATALLLVGTASAGKPFKDSFDNGVEVFVDADVCAAAPWGFDVDVVQHEYGFFDVFFDQEGNTTKAIAHFNYEATISANGNTIVERDTWQATFFPDGTSRASGSTVHIQGPGGIVVRDAGQVVFNADGSVNFAHGPHEQLIDNVSFCPALTH